MSITRRRFLAGLGGAAVALPVLESVKFRTGSAQIDPDSHSILNQVALVMRANPDKFELVKTYPGGFYRIQSYLLYRVNYD